MEQRGIGGDAVPLQLVEQAPVEVQAGRVGAALRVHHARPGDGEAVVPQAQRGHQRDVLGVAVVVVAGHEAVAGVLDAAGLRTEIVPDAGQLATLVRTPLDLESGGGAAPFKSSRKNRSVGHL